MRVRAQVVRVRLCSNGVERWRGGRMFSAERVGNCVFFFLVLGSCFAKRYPLLGSDRKFFGARSRTITRI